MLDEIRSACEVGWSRSTSIVDTLLNSKLCEEADLIRAYEALQQEEEDFAAAFFQLPTLIRLPEEWIAVRSKYTNSRILFRPIGTLHNSIDKSGHFSMGTRNSYDSLEPMSNAILPGDHYGFMIRTQVLVLYQLWGVRQPWYRPYLNSLASIHQYRMTLVDQSDSWLKEPRPMSAAEYELDLARRLLRESLSVLKIFIPTYTVACMDPHTKVPEYVSNFVMMVKSGRLVTLGPGRSIIAEFAKPFQLEDYSGNVDVLRMKLESGEKHTIYEEYLLEAIREIERGAFNLAVVQTVMIIEWFANEIIQDRVISHIRKAMIHRMDIAELAISRMWNSRSSLLDKFMKYLPHAGINLEKQMQKDLKEIIELRNKIIHKNQTSPVSKSQAIKAVKTAMVVIQASMGCLRHTSPEEHVQSDTQPNSRSSPLPTGVVADR